jgi:hypothetical protein
MDHIKEFLKTFERMTGRRSRYEIFHDFVTMASSAFIVKACPWEAERSEAEYMAIAGKYDRDELNKFAELLSHTILSLAHEPQDFLGEAFMRAEVSNDRLGQFFTPYSLSYAIAKMTAHDVPDREIITVQEPACGSGGMVIAFCAALEDLGIDAASRSYTVATDISEVAARMAYIQLTIRNIPAHVVWGDTLRMTVTRQWPTMAYWPIAHKVEQWRRGEAMDIIAEPKQEPKTYAQAAFDFA